MESKLSAFMDFDIEAETAFKLDDASRVGGSAPSIAKYTDSISGEYWVGKSDLGSLEAATQVIACKEKLANDIYGFYGIRVPRLRLSRQKVLPETRQLYGYRDVYACHIMSRWVDRFKTYYEAGNEAHGEKFELMALFPQEGAAHFTLPVTLDGQVKHLPEKGLGHILAVAHWLNDIDVLNPGGKNVGYQLQLDSAGQLYALSCKIDPGFAFSFFERKKGLTLDLRIQLGADTFILFSQLPIQTQQEYVLTLRQIINTSDQQLAHFFKGRSSQILESTAARQMGSYIPIKTYIKILNVRRQALAALHRDSLAHLPKKKVVLATQQLLEEIQKLYCPAKLSYELEVREKVAFHIPLDVADRPHSEHRTPLNKSLMTFLQSKDKKVFVLVGASGAGKSLSTQLWVEALWQDYLRDLTNPIPLRVELKQFSAKTVGQCILNVLLDDYRLSQEQLTQLQQHRFVFILDGYDEIAEQTHINLIKAHAQTEKTYGHWNTQFIVTCRESYFEGLDRSLFYPAEDQRGVWIQYLSPLTPQNQITYLMDYKKAHPDKALPDYETLLKENPHLQALLTNPFLLRIFRDALPQWQQEHSKTSLKELNSYDLYTAFLQHWFQQERLRLSMIKNKPLPETQIQQFLQFAQTLAFEMHLHKVDEVDTQNQPSAWWDQFFSDPSEGVKESRAACPLRRGGVYRYSFVHKSFLEYFVARQLWEGLERQAIDVWNQRLLPETPDILSFLGQQLQKPAHHVFKALLWSWVQASKQSEKVAIVAANAITLLNHVGVAFIGEYGDLAGVHIAGADLSGAVCSAAQFQGADLQCVNFKGAYLSDANFIDARMEGVIFGEYPSLQAESSVYCIAYSPDGQRIAVGEENGITLYQKSIAQGASEYYEMTYFKCGTLQEYTSSVHSVVFSPDGTRIASASWDNTVRLWDVKTFVAITALQGHTSFVHGVAFSPDGGMLASGSSDDTVRLWDIKNQTAQSVLIKGHTNWVNSVVFSLDGGMLASGSYDKTVRLWDVKNQAALGVLEGHSSGVTSVAFSPDGGMLASGSYDKTVRLWDVKNQAALGVLTGHTNIVRDVAFSPDGVILALVNRGTLLFWDVRTRVTLEDLEKPTCEAQKVAFSPDGGMLVSCNWDRTVRLWDAKTQAPLSALQGHTTSVTSVAFRSDGAMLASGSQDGSVFLWARRIDLSSGSEKWRLNYRFSNSTALFAENAFFNGATLSEGNRQLLEQRGANFDQRPSGQRLTFWSSPPPSVSDSVVVLPATPTGSAVSTVTIPPSTATLAVLVRDCVDALNQKLPQLSLSFDEKAAYSFTATLLRALRKNMLAVLAESPDDYGIPFEVMAFLRDYLADHSNLQQAVEAEPSKVTADIENVLLRGELPPIAPEPIVTAPPPLPPFPTPTRARPGTPSTPANSQQRQQRPDKNNDPEPKCLII